MSDSSRFVYVPGSTLASRRIIEQSSYRTTPDQSSADPTPACGEAVYKTSLDDEKMNTVNLILEMEQTPTVKRFSRTARKNPWMAEMKSAQAKRQSIEPV